MRLLILIGSVLVFASSSAFAQSEKEKGAQRSNAFEPYTAKEEKAQVKQLKKSKKKSFNARFNRKLDRKMKEFEKRMQANAKEDRKMARAMLKPQYSDPSYFGHKRKPKKRPVGKRKFCKECGIVH